MMLLDSWFGTDYLRLKSRGLTKPRTAKAPCDAVELDVQVSDVRTFREQTLGAVRIGFGTRQTVAAVESGYDRVDSWTSAISRF